MGMTMTQKILAAHAGLESVQPGQLVTVSPDLAFAHDVSAPVVLNYFEQNGFDKVKYPERMFLIMDHTTPCKDIKSAENCRRVREFAKSHGIERFIDGGTGQTGICHGVIPEQGHVAPGELVIGGDSHTVTYGAVNAFSTGIGVTDIASWMVSGVVWVKIPSAIKFYVTGELKPWVSGKDVMLWIIHKIGVSGALYKSMEFMGPGLKHLSMDARLTIANMSVEAGAKNGIFAYDEITEEYMKGRVDRPFTAWAPDEDAEYEETIEVNLSEIEPMVAFPHLPGNGKPVREAEKIELNEVFIGSCTNGRLSDLEAAAKVLKGHKVKEGLRVIVVPATPQIYKDALKLGYLETFLDAGCVILNPNCAACGGLHMGMMGKGEKVLTTTNRNFRGRMGHIDSLIYLASPATAAASAITGVITSPHEIEIL